MPSARCSCRATPRPARPSRRSSSASSPSEGQVLLGWRDVPVDPSGLGESVKPTEPVHRQIFIGRGADRAGPGDLRAQALPHPQESSPTPSMRCTIPTHAGLVSGLAVLAHDRLQGHAARLAARRLFQGPARPNASRPPWPSCTSASRPTPSRPGSWRIPSAWSPITARSTRCAATSTGWRRARPRSPRALFGDDISKLWPISYEGQSDTACFDNALEFLVQGGYSLAHAMMMLIPEAWAGNPLMDEERRAFYEYHAALMEPWDGPAAIAFTDGRQIGATLDRNGLRPARYHRHRRRPRGAWPRRSACCRFPKRTIITKWRLAARQDAARRSRAGPHHLRRRDQERARARASLREWLEAHPDRARRPASPSRPARSRADVSLLDRQQAFGYTQEDISDPDGADGA